MSQGARAIDMHAHWVPPQVAHALRQRQGQVPRLEVLDDGAERLVMPIGTLGFSPAHTDPSLRLQHMLQQGVAKQMLSLPGLFGIDSLPFDQAAPLVRAFNDACSQLCRTHPERFCGLAALPLADMDAAVAELRRARLELGLLGAILPVDAFRSEATAARIRPVFEAADALGAHFFVHPGRMPDSGALPDTPPDHDLARRALAVQHEVGEVLSRIRRQVRPEVAALAVQAVAREAVTRVQLPAGVGAAPSGPHCINDARDFAFELRCGHLGSRPEERVN